MISSVTVLQVMGLAQKTPKQPQLLRLSPLKLVTAANIAYPKFIKKIPQLGQKGLGCLINSMPKINSLKDKSNPKGNKIKVGKSR